LKLKQERKNKAPSGMLSGAAIRKLSGLIALVNCCIWQTFEF